MGTRVGGREVSGSCVNQSAPLPPTPLQRAWSGSSRGGAGKFDTPEEARVLAQGLVHTGWCHFKLSSTV